MKFLFRSFVAGMLVVSCATACAEAALQDRLAKLNRSPTHDDATRSEHSTELLARFDGRPFQCRNSIDYTPEETAEAASAFDAFVRYVKHGDSIQDFWMDPKRRAERERLIAKAIEIGSWKAEYVDAVWRLTTRSSSDAHEKAVRQLEGLVERGIPIAAYKYATFLDRDPDEQYRIHAEAIDRGSADSMAAVGGNMIARSMKLRADGKAMLECALAQGKAETYSMLGKLALMEGRWVDAYRLWGEGVNKGCDSCVSRLLAFARIRPGYRLSQPREDFMPELERIRRFYAKNYFYSDTRLDEFKMPLPSDMAFHFSDEELVTLLEQ